MRVLLATGITAALVLVACGGCSSVQMPSFLPSFGAKAKSSKPNSSELTNAPLAPQFNSMSGVSPSVSMPPSSSWSNLPVYPGTNYPQTPYPDQAAVGGSTAPAYASNPPGATGYPSNYGTMPPSASPGPSSPYAPYSTAGGQAPSYAQQAAPPYAAQQAPPYAGQQVPPYAGQQTPSYAQQQAPAYGGGQAAPYSAQQNPYGATTEPYNAANPYGSYTR